MNRILKSVILTFSVVFVLINLLSCKTGSKQVKKSDTKSSVSLSNETYYLKELHEKCKNPDIVEIERKSEYVEIEYLCEGKMYELILDKKNKAIASETETPVSNITSSMYKKINKNYPGWTIDECNEVNVNDTILLKVELFKDGIEQNIYFTQTGKLFKASQL